MFFQRNFKFTLESLDINYVIEATGKYKTFEDLNAHIAGAKKVILSAPSEVDSIKTVVIGVNDHILDGTETIISNELYHK
jgi:glyceraldehyde 3-phosphate dehydrogenase